MSTESNFGLGIGTGVLVVYFMLLGFMVGVFVFGELHRELHAVIKECESTLPRNQICSYTIVAAPNPITEIPNE